MVQAEKLLDVRQVFGDGGILALRLWRVSQPVPPATHLFRYALFYGPRRQQAVLFENERGKGNHKHIREVESPYVFTTPERLVEDFLAAVRVVRNEDTG